MGQIGQGYGSEWHFLQLLARRRGAFTELVETTIGCRDLEWRDHDAIVDPKTGFLRLHETRGLEFLDEGHPARREWAGLWPQSGNVHNWDAVGQGHAEDRTTFILVEAKAHIGELNSSCGAKAKESINRIRDLLVRTRHELGVTAESDWTADYYQYCNRIALLQFLQSRDVDAHLLFLYFTGDRTDVGGGGRNCPANESGWAEALERQDTYVGLPASAPIRRRIHRLFLPVYRTAFAGQPSAKGTGGVNTGAGSK